MTKKLANPKVSMAMKIERKKSFDRNIIKMALKMKELKKKNSK